MPLYEYTCDGRSQKVLLLQSMAIQSQETICPQCGGKNLKRLFSSFSSRTIGGAPTPSGAGHGHSGKCGCS